MVTLRILFALAIAMTVVGLTGCDDNNSELERSAISVSAVNEAGVYVCATWDAGQNKAFPDFDPADRDDFQPFAHMQDVLPVDACFRILRPEPGRRQHQRHGREGPRFRRAKDEPYAQQRP